jgi:hypothetical protein
LFYHWGSDCGISPSLTTPCYLYGSELAARVIYCQPDEFISRLGALPGPEVKAEAEPKKSHGYKVKRPEPKLSPEEQKQREEAAIRAIAEAMRKKSK